MHGDLTFLGLRICSSGKTASTIKPPLSETTGPEQKQDEADKPSAIDQAHR